MIGLLSPILLILFGAVVLWSLWVWDHRQNWIPQPIRNFIRRYLPAISVSADSGIAASLTQAEADLTKQKRLALKEQRNQKETEAEIHIVRAKLQIAEQLSMMKTLATERGAWSKPHNERGEKFMAARSLANSRIEEISYETQLRVDCLEFIHLCEVIIATDKDHELNEDERKQLHVLSASLMQRLHGKG